MKKFFTLICAIAIAFSASAAPIAPKAELVKKAPVAVEMQKVQLEKAQVANFNQLSATPALKVNNLKGKVAPAVKPAARKLATGEPIVVIIKGNPQIASKSGKTTIEVTGNDDIIYGWVVSTESLEAGKTYTYADMGAYNVYRYDNSFTVYEEATDGTFSIDAEKNITASMVTESGTYMVYTNDPTPQPSYDTIPVTVVKYQEQYYASSLDWQVIMRDTAGNGYSFDIFAPAEGFESGKTYSSDNGDFDLEYTFAQVNGVGDVAVKASFTKTVSATEIKVVAEMTTAANHVYQFTYTEKLTDWTEWAKFAPLGKSTGTWTFSAVSSFSGATCVSNIYVREDKDNSAKQQIKVEGWGAEVLSVSGVDLIIDWDTITNVCTIAEQSTGAYQSAYQEYTMISDLNTYIGGTSYPSYYDPATGKFSLAVVYYISKGEFGYGTETLQMKSSEIKPLQYDATDADFSADFSNDDTKVSITGTTATVSATDADLKTLSLEMYVTSGSAQIPAGDYTITDSKEVGTALASEGVSGGYVTASFAGIRNAQGQITTPMWFLVEGNVNVAYNDYIMTLTVAAKNSNGKNINITVTKDYTPVVERDTIDIVSTALKYNDLIASNKVVVYYAADVPNYYLFRVTSNNATAVDGTFKWSDGTINDPNSYFSVSGTDKNYFQDGEFTVVTNNKDIALTGWMIGVDEKYYRLDMSYTAPTERDTVYVNSKMLSSFYEESIKGYVYKSSNADYELIQFVTNKDTKLGTFAYSDLQYGYSYLQVHKTDKTAILFQDGEITVSEDPEGFKLTGLMIGEDEKAYVFNLIQPASVLEYDTDAPFDATFAYNEMDASIKDGVISISLQKGTEFAMELELYADPAATTIPEGTYTISDSKEASTALQSTGYGEQEPAACYAATLVVQQSKLYLDDMWFLVEGTITLSYDEYGKLKVVVDAKNSYGQPVTALVKYEKLEPKSVVTIEADNMKFTGAGTMFLLDAANTNYEVVLMVTSTDTAGTYGVEDLVATYSAIYSADGSQVSILDGEFTLALNGKEMTLTGSLLASDTIQYDLNITGYMGALPYDQTSDFEATFELDSADVQTGAATTLTVTNDNNQMVALMFFAKATGNKLPAGTYPINNTKAKNTVLASQGYTTSGFTYSFAAETNDQGQITNPWWIVSGEVVVAEDGSITVNALNSYDKTITINIVAAAPEVTDYYLVGWIDGAAYGIEGDIDNFGDYHFVDGKVTATFNEDSYVQVKDNNKQIYGTASYVAPVAEGTSAIVLATGTEKMGVYASEYEFTLDIAEDGTMTLSYAPVATGLYRINANTAIRKALIKGHVVIFKNDKAFNLMGAEL